MIAHYVNVHLIIIIIIAYFRCECMATRIIELTLGDVDNALSASSVVDCNEHDQQVGTYDANSNTRHLLRSILSDGRNCRATCVCTATSSRDDGHYLYTPTLQFLPNF